MTMNVSAIDSRLFGDMFGTEDVRKIFSDEAYVARMVQVEVALAKAEAEANVIPKEAADAIAKYD